MTKTKTRKIPLEIGFITTHDGFPRDLELRLLEKKKTVVISAKIEHYPAQILETYLFEDKPREKIMEKAERKYNRILRIINNCGYKIDLYPVKREAIIRIFDF